MNEGTEGTCSKFDHDAKLGGVGDSTVLCSHAARPGQAQKPGREETSEVQRRQVPCPAPGEEKPRAPAQAGG